MPESETQPAWAERLRSEREERLWDIPEMARQLRQVAAGAPLPDVDNLSRMIKKWESGKHLPGERYQLLYSRAFGVGRTALFETAPERARPEPELLDVVGVADEIARMGAWAESSNVGEHTLAYHRDAVRRLARDYLQQPPLPILHRTATLTREVFRLLQSGRQRLDQTRELLITAAKLCALMSWISGDLGQPAVAEAHAGTAWTLAQQTSEPTAQALALSTKSKVAFWDGRLRQAAEFAQQGYTLSVNDTMKVFLACQEADAWQALGNIPKARDALRNAEAAREIIDRSDTVGGVFGCGIARQSNYAAGVHLRAANPDEALRQAERGLNAYDQGEEWAYGTWGQIHIEMALAHIAKQEIDGAAAALRPVLALPPEQRLSTLATRLIQLGRVLDGSRFRGSAEARTLRSEIREYRAIAAS
ncbi:hypothetical protein ACQP25_30830 [Microtetraspora malaysiensis]|uniref:hypothetical protein n=1 Tax=Microtetraspora malaysiensis TaxID=161358 RepID=UPI003D8D6F0B